MKFSIGQAQHIGKRKQQQDRSGHASMVRGGATVVVVADGMGGMAHGDKASETALAAFLKCWREADPRTPLAESLKACFEAANADVFRVADELKAAGEVGTTLIAAAFGKDGMYWGSVGDSAIYHIRGGTMRQVNVFHTYGRELDLLADQGVVPRVVVMNHPEREALTSFIGLEEIRMMDSNAAPLPLEPGDWILLATDGLFKTLEPGEILSLVKGTAQKACEEMVKRAIDAGEPYQDNVTVLAVHAEQEKRRVSLPLLVTAFGAASAVTAWALRRRA